MILPQPTPPDPPHIIPTLPNSHLLFPLIRIQSYNNNNDNNNIELDKIKTNQPA